MKKLCTIFALCLATFGMARDIVVNDDVAYGLAEVLYCEVEWNGNAAVGTFYFSDNTSAVVDDLRTISFQAPMSVANGVQDETLRMYPNPTTDYLTIESAQEGDVRIFDLSGTLILQQPVSAGTSVLQTGQLPQGTYLLQLNNKIFKLNKK